MKFNLEKCEVMYFGGKNMERQHKIRGKIVKCMQEQRDLGVYVHKFLKIAGQVERAVNKAYSILDFINSSIEYMSKKLC